MRKSLFKTISRSALINNVQSVREHMGKNSQVCAVVKAEAYGHGISVVGSVLQDYVDHFAVVSNTEALKLRRIAPGARILILGAANPAKLAQVVSNDIEFTVCSHDDLTLATKAALKAGKPALLHIKLNTGMNRLGIDTVSQLEQMLDIINKEPMLSLEGVFSHVGDSENKRCTQQSERFDALCETLPRSVLKHIACSGILLTHPETEYNMTRAGIAIYGYGPCPDLRPVMSVYSKILATRNVKKGEYIGYGLNHKAHRDMRVAVLDIGYAEGLPRNYANGGKVIINGHFAPICANICMDMTMVDITSVPNVKPQDFAVILGSSGGKSVTALDIARVCKTIEYEILTNFRDIKGYVTE